MLLSQRGQVVQLLVVDAVGSGADHKTGNHGVGEGFLITLTQHLQRGVGVAVRLEVGHIARGFPVAAGVETDALLNLLRDAACRAAISGRKGFAVAEGAACGAERAVAIGTGEAAIHGNLLRR